MPNFSYENLTSRNYLYISSVLQKTIKKTKLAFLGSGLSSNIAIQAVRLGFENIYLHDGDRVELSNLNRQLFSFADIGRNKVEILKENILAINPFCNISFNNKFINSIESIKDIIDSSEIIINTVDCKQIYFDIIEYGRTQNKLVICPFNPGFAGLVLCFSEKSDSCWEIFDKVSHLDDFEISKQLFIKYPEINAPEQASVSIEEFLRNAKQYYFPQTTIGAFITSSMVLTTIIKYLRSEPLKLAPEIYYLNTYY